MLLLEKKGIAVGRRGTRRRRGLQDRRVQLLEEAGMMLEVRKKENKKEKKGDGRLARGKEAAWLVCVHGEKT